MSDWFKRFGFAEVGKGLLTGAYPLDADDVAALSRAGVTRAFNLVEDDEYYDDERATASAALAAAGIEEQRLELVDYAGMMPGQIEQALRTVVAWLDAGERVYLHCRAGWQRSAAIAAAVVAVREGVDLKEALARVRDRKPTAEPLPNQRADLEIWWSLRETAAAAAEGDITPE